MKEAFSLIIFLSGLSLIIIGISFYWTEGPASASKLAVASGIWLKFYWASMLQEEQIKR
ncbi:MAG: hypothetical protein H6559_13525 [Lewinellaceae bacterium]|nr:hypothetical protein [Lewinellaceae bacterium]